ncbi:MAG: OadG family protein [Treponemataceae bacterium]|jgi:oxaloacetate decarboxylase gamma subunit|nr:OadG family protein [Treponemataceae bacterium]
MTITQMLSQSLILTLLGMSVVFTFLIILIVFVSLTAKVIKALKLDQDKTTDTATSTTNSAQKNKVVAAIAAALREKQV